MFAHSLESGTDRLHAGRELWVSLRLWSSEKKYRMDEKLDISIQNY
jgi:hypothetical protein